MNFCENFLTSKLTPLLHFCHVLWKEWLVNSDRPDRLAGSIAARQPRCSTMACSRDFGGGYESCSHWSNLWCPRKDSTRHPRRQVDPIGRTLRALKNVPLSVSILPESNDNMPTETPPSWCCGTFPVIANSHWSRSRANMNAWRNFTRFSTLRLCHTLATTRCRTSHFLARWSHAAHREYQRPAAPRSCGSFWIG